MCALLNALNSDDKKIINIANINTHKHSIIYADNCEVYFYSKNESFIAPVNSMIFVERGVRYSCKVIKHKPDCPPFKILNLGDESLQALKCILTTVYEYKLDGGGKLQRVMQEKVISVEATNESILLFNDLLTVTDNRMKALKIAYLMSRFTLSKMLFHSVIVSSGYTFADKVRDLISNDISRKWRLGSIADSFNISEITVRKRLESEGISFNNLMLSLRMNEAKRLLLENNKQIHQIAKHIGLSSSSYFIRLFKEFYGVTPKQYVIYFRS